MSHCRKRAAEAPVQAEDEVKRQRLAKLAAWRQQQAGAAVKVEQPSSPQPVRVFEDPADETPEPEPQQAAWYVMVLLSGSSHAGTWSSLLVVSYAPAVCNVLYSSSEVSIASCRFYCFVSVNNPDLTAVSVGD